LLVLAINPDQQWRPDWLEVQRIVFVFEIEAEMPLKTISQTHGAAAKTGREVGARRDIHEGATRWRRQALWLKHAVRSWRKK
jgi:hypothetical protein